MRISDWSSDVCSSDLVPHYRDPFDPPTTLSPGRLPQLWRAQDAPQGLGAGARRATPAARAGRRDVALWREAARQLARPDLPILPRRDLWPRSVRFPRGAGQDRKSTRLNSITNAHLVCRLLLEKKINTPTQKINYNEVQH